MSERKKVVIDTNILISGIFWGGNPNKILGEWNEEKFSVLITLDILEEYLEIIRRIGKDKEITEQWKSYIIRNTKIIDVTNKPKISRDAKDDKFIWCALAGKADYIITGDDDLLVLKDIGKTKILKPADFLRI